MIVYFQEFKTRELVLHSAWKKKEIYHGDRRIYFNNDYPAKTLAKRKAYALGMTKAVPLRVLND